MITPDRLREVLAYDPDTGQFHWRVRGRGKYKRPGAHAGHYDGRYVTMRVDGRKYYAHRLAWVYVHGVWPDGDIDHINEDKSDNRISNLRPASRSQNMLNVSRASERSQSGVRGVSPRRGRWRATISGRHIGDFDTIEEAAAARGAAR